VEPSVVFEGALTHVATMARVGAGERMPVADANVLRARIGSVMRDSIDSPDRYALGAVQFVDTQVVGRILAKLIREPDHPDNVPIRELPGVPEAVMQKVARVAPQVSRGRLLAMPLAEMSDRFGLKLDEAIALRRAALGLSGPAPDPGTRWNPPGSAGPAGCDDQGGGGQRQRTSR
jgi:hypothetical protein